MYYTTYIYKHLFEYEKIQEQLESEFSYLIQTDNIWVYILRKRIRNG